MMNYDKAIVDLQPFKFMQTVYLIKNGSKEKKEECTMKMLPALLSSFDVSEVDFVGYTNLGKKIAEECKTLYNMNNVTFMFNKFF